MGRIAKGSLGDGRDYMVVVLGVGLCCPSRLRCYQSEPGNILAEAGGQDALPAFSPTGGPPPEGRPLAATSLQCWLRRLREGQSAVGHAGMRMSMHAPQPNGHSHAAGCSGTDRRACKGWGRGTPPACPAQCPVRLRRLKACCEAPRHARRKPCDGRQLAWAANQPSWHGHLRCKKPYCERAR